MCGPHTPQGLSTGPGCKSPAQGSSRTPDPSVTKDMDAPLPEAYTSGRQLTGPRGTSAVPDGGPRLPRAMAPSPERPWDGTSRPGRVSRTSVSQTQGIADRCRDTSNRKPHFLCRLSAKQPTEETKREERRTQS